MITIVNRKNTVTIPEEVGQKLGIKPGWRLDWQLVEGRDEILVRVIPGRGERARRLLGSCRKLSSDRDAVAELVAERTEVRDEGDTRTPLGSRIAARFAGIGLTEDIPELRGEAPRPADFES